MRLQFNSLKLPALVMSVIPFGLAGTVLALLLTGVPLGATLIIGILVVIALTVNQGVLLITFTESLRINDNLSAQEAIIAAAKIRLRPVLMLSFCFIAGLIPLALNIEEGGDMLQPMAIGAIGGAGAWLDGHAVPPALSIRDLYWGRIIVFTIEQFAKERAVSLDMDLWGMEKMTRQLFKKYQFITY